MDRGPRAFSHALPSPPCRHQTFSLWCLGLLSTEALGWRGVDGSWALRAWRSAFVFLFGEMVGEARLERSLQQDFSQPSSLVTFAEGLLWARHRARCWVMLLITRAGPRE